MRPTQISKVAWDLSLRPNASHRGAQINTALQLLLMGLTTVNPVLPVDLAWPIVGLQ